jgi:hypothetical protein
MGEDFEHGAVGRQRLGCCIEFQASGSGLRVGKLLIVGRVIVKAAWLNPPTHGPCPIRVITNF